MYIEDSGNGLPSTLLW